MIILIYVPVNPENESDLPLMFRGANIEFCIDAFNSDSGMNFESLFLEDESNFLAFDECGDYKKIQKSFALVD
jgi:hypothetical protein